MINNGIEVLARKLTTPKNYYSGYSSPLNLFFPRKTLIFHRTTAKELMHAKENRFFHHRHVLIVNWKTKATVQIGD